MRLPRDELVQDHAEGVDISPFRDGSVRCELLRRHVSERPDHDVRSNVAGRDCDPEIGDPYTSVLVDQDIGGFQIAMKNAPPLRGSGPRTPPVGDFWAPPRRPTAGWA